MKARNPGNGVGLAARRGGRAAAADTGAKETRRYDAQQARAAILSAAREALLKEGYGGATLRSVAERAGVPHSLVSYHFASKAGLVDAVVEDLYGWLKPWAEAFVKGRTPDAATLHGLAAGAVEAVAANPEAVQARLGRGIAEDDRLREQIIKLGREPFQEAVEFLRRGIEAGTIRRCDPEVTVAFAIASVRAFFEDAHYYSKLAGRDLSADEARAGLREVLFGLVSWLLADPDEPARCLPAVRRATHNPSS